MNNPASAPTTTTATTTPITIPFTLVVDFCADCVDAAEGKADAADAKADAPRFGATVAVATVVDSADVLGFLDTLDEEVAAAVLVVLASEPVEEVIVRDKVLEISLPFGDRRTPVPLLQQSGELSQQ